MRRSLLCTLLLVAGCLGPRADLSTFYVITANADPDANGAPLAVSLGLGPVVLPGYLDRSELVTRLNENQVALSEMERWAEPLLDNVSRVLTENLVRVLQPDGHVAYPWYESADVDYGVAVRFTRFEADSAGSVTLDASWRITSGNAQETLYRGDSLIQEDATAVAAERRVAALSRALAQLSDEIAVAVRRVHAGASF
jgi:uncharacterized lipoprotein YmbA